MQFPFQSNWYLNESSVLTRNHYTPDAIHEALSNFRMRACRRGTSINRHSSLCLPLNARIRSFKSECRNKMDLPLSWEVKQCSVLQTQFAQLRTQWICVEKYDCFLIAFFTLEQRAHLARTKRPTAPKHRVNEHTSRTNAIEIAIDVPMEQSNHLI